MKGRLLPVAVLLRLGVTLSGLAAVGLIGIGLSGLLALCGGWLLGKNFVAADQSGVSYTPSRCHDLFEYAPHAHSCEQAAVIHHYGELVDSRIAAGAVGIVLAILTALIVRRWRSRIAPIQVLPEGFAATVGVTLFGAADLILLASGLAQTAFDNARGAGGNLSGGIVAVAIALYYGLTLYSVIQGRADSPTTPTV